MTDAHIASTVRDNSSSAQSFTKEGRSSHVGDASFDLVLLSQQFHQRREKLTHL